ncbi:MAG: ArdC family protein, partial [Desulfobulbia bacterium]
MNNIYDQITDQIVEALESAGQWESPFRVIANGGFPVSAATGKHYNGINILNLWSAAQNAGFGSNEWGTFKQWKARGFAVQKGQKSVAKVVFYKALNITDKETGEDK